MRVGVTGANGLVGSALVQTLLRQGHEVVRFQRQASDPALAVVPFALGTPVSKNAFEGLDAVVHCAYDFRLQRPEAVWKANVESSLDFFARAKAAGVGTRLFVSSVSSYPGCQSTYGKAKWAVEQTVVREGGAAVRPGLVFSPGLKGMFGALWKIVKLPVLPLFDGGTQTMVVVHCDDLAEAIVSVLEQFPVYAGKVFPVANPEPRTFRNLLLELAALQKKKVRFFSVPSRWAVALLRLAEKCAIPLPFKSDSLLGLVGALSQYDFSHLPPLGHPYRNPIDLKLTGK
jgi:nucleoside-diphosphate-sugar epimerase